VSADKPCWYGEGLRFSCTQSGRCCTGPPGYVWFDDAEAAAIAKYLGMTEAHLRRHYARCVNGRWTLEERVAADGGYDCAFLGQDDGGKPACQIYAVRPMQCRTWPFWAENLASERAWLRAAKRCAGMAAGLAGAGRLYSVKEIDTERDTTACDE